VFEVLLHVTDATRGVAWSGGETLPVAGLYSRSLDRTQDWNFVVFGNEVFEQYKLYAFQVTVTQEGP
jgi:hypothetical protein